MKRLLVLLGVLFFCVAIVGGNCLAKDAEVKDVVPVSKSMGETVYVPAVKRDISYVFDSVPVDQLLSSLVLVRNTDRYNPITITSVDVYDENGVFEKSLLTGDPQVLDTLASTSYNVSVHPNERTVKGRRGVLVTWQADTYVNQPVIAGAIVITGAADLGTGRVSITHSVSHGRIID